jgi:hypothetical protein
MGSRAKTGCFRFIWRPSFGRNAEKSNIDLPPDNWVVQNARFPFSLCRLSMESNGFPQQSRGRSSLSLSDPVTVNQGPLLAESSRSASA